MLPGCGVQLWGYCCYCCCWGKKGTWMDAPLAPIVHGPTKRHHYVSLASSSVFIGGQRRVCLVVCMVLGIVLWVMCW